MSQDNFTPTPNILFDKYLKELNLSELKILLVIIRQTNGWMNPKTRKRKGRDRITYNQFIKKTGLSKRAVSNAINSLSQKHLIQITDHKMNILINPADRKGKYHIYYSSLLEQIQYLHTLNSTSANNSTNQCKKRHQLVQKVHITKETINKIKYTKEREDSLKQIGEVIKEKWNIS